MERNTQSWNTTSALKRARTPEIDEHTTHEHQSQKMRKMSDFHVTDITLVNDFPASNRDTGSATTSPTQSSLPPRATLQGLPRELRDQIYENLAETEERIVLGWRFVEAYKGDDTLPLDECFDLAVALHPLSMTCKQMLAEFQDIHFSASEACWTLLVNNFDLEQLMLFGDYIDSRVFIEPVNWAFDETYGFSRPEFNVNLNLRFQTDHHALRSATELCELFLSDKNANTDTLCALKRCMGIPVEIETNHTLRTTASKKYIQSMRREQAEQVDLALRTLRSRGSISKPSLRFWTYERMESCWLEPFSKAVKSMRG